MEILELVQAYKRTFATPAGEQVLEDLRGFCGDRSDAFVPGDPYHTIYNVGARRVLLRIQNFLEREIKETPDGN